MCVCENVALPYLLYLADMHAHTGLTGDTISAQYSKPTKPKFAGVVVLLNLLSNMESLYSQESFFLVHWLHVCVRVICPLGMPPFIPPFLLLSLSLSLMSKPWSPFFDHFCVSLARWCISDICQSYSGEKFFFDSTHSHLCFLM